MTKIYLNIEAESVSELLETVGQFVSNPAPILQKAVDEVAEKKQQKKATKVKKEQTEEKAASTEQTSEEKDSSTKKDNKKTETKSVDNEPDKSITEGRHPNATKADVQAAMKKAMDGGHRPEVKTAFGRFNAGKLSDLKEEDYSAFITDLEALIATAGD
ncbi:hypothetical protein [Enterococcus sp. DIV0170]|uniref:hypothetical protein n=1 Tax=Enterococcus sp. DIV0170 TaxID=2774642 RepID=UPI003F24C61E